MAVEEALAGIGELVFSLLIGYFGALELVFVTRQVFHWGCRHATADVDAAADAQELPRLRQRLEDELADATAREQRAGTNVMQDGVMYSNGFRIDPAQLNPMSTEKREALEAELQRQKHIEEETRKLLAEAEAKLAEERRIAEEERKAAAEAEALAAEAAEAAENARKLIEVEKKREAEQREREEKERKLAEEEKLREAEQREREENERKLIEAEKQREAEQREREENERKLIEAEKQREAEQREREEIERIAKEQQEREENERLLIAAEEERLDRERQRELAEAEAAENERRLFEAETEKQRKQAEEEEADNKQARLDAELVEMLLAAERERKLSATESELEEEAVMAEQARRLLESKTELENKQKLIEENARRFLEAEEEMVVLQHRMLEAAQASEYAGQTPVVEEPCIKKILPPRFEKPDSDPEQDLGVGVEVEEPLVVQKVKTQFGQTTSGEDPYLVKSKTLTFPSVSDEGSSVEPNSSQQSSFSTQPSEELTTEALRLHLDLERQEPEGEDNVSDVQYTDDYLRSLDGIKNRPLMREDGSGRRRAFKKRRSSGSSNSSRDSRTSREEELRMFTSLEEEELRQGDKDDYNPIKYTSEPTLRVKSHHRRHKRSPAKDMKPPSSDAGSSLEMLGEESTNPWGELTPEHYKNTEFWKREKALSIDEEELELEKHASGEEVVEPEVTTAMNVPKASSFEEATEAQNKQAATALQQQRSMENVEKDNSETSKAANTSTSNSDNKSNLQTSSTTEAHSRHSSPGLRRSPRIDEMDHYEERWCESEADAARAAAVNASQMPSISVNEPDTAPWRDQYGLLMEGISDFYDFTASVNPSRSRSTSRNPSPQPKNVANLMDVDNEHSLEVYDDTDILLAGELNCESVLELLETTMNAQMETVACNGLQLQNVADDASHANNSSVVPMVFEPAEDTLTDLQTPELQTPDFPERLGPSPPPRRSRSRSPLPTADNLEKSINTRRERLIKHNDDIFEKISGHSTLMEVDINGDTVHDMNSHSPSPKGDNSMLPQPVIEINEMADASPGDQQLDEAPPEQLRIFLETLRAERNSRSRSRSSSRSPLPTADNVTRSLETRRQRRIQQNDELLEQLQQEIRAKTPEREFKVASPLHPLPPIISIECVDEGAAAVDPEPIDEEPVDTPESMAQLFEQLRLNRIRSHSRSRSKSPLPSAMNLEHSLENRRQKLIAQNDALFEQLQERAKTPEPPRLTVEHVYEFVECDEPNERYERDMRSLSPSRSRSVSPEYTPEDLNKFNLMLNLEGSENRTLCKNSEESESVLAAKQRELDFEALHKLTNANEEVELRVLSPTETDRKSVNEMPDLPQIDRLPDYERTVSEVARDIKSKLMVSGFKRSTYVGESLDLGSEFEPLRREAAQFDRSRSPSPSIDSLSLEDARMQAAAQRELQAAILDSLTTTTTSSTEKPSSGAKPKTNEYERTFSEEVKDTLRMKEEMLSGDFRRSTYVGESLDLGLSTQLDDLRHQTAEFQRSRSQSRSPPADEQVNTLKNIDNEVAKREMQDQLLDQLAASSVNFENFSRHLNADFLDSERRASDSALMQSDPFAGLEPEEYHHFRRFSLAQEQPVEEYPSDDYVYISQIEVRTLTGTRTWLKEDFYSHDLGSFELNFSDFGSMEIVDKDSVLDKSESVSVDEGAWAHTVIASESSTEFDSTNAIYNFDIVGDYGQQDNEGSEGTNDSEDERQTVVEIEDELDEGISDYNERGGPTDESHHDTSECEEAERNADRYANRNANDWEEIEDVEDFLDLSLDEGAVGGGGVTPYSDPDSFIEQIYNEAVKNRKQSGILRDYETMVREQLPQDNSESDKETKSSSDSERYALWAKTRALELEQSGNKNVDVTLGLLESERRDTEMRYLGDANVVARQSTRLRTRYGYSPKLQVSALEDDFEVDMNYKPKREYNWRKNFKLDDNDPLPSAPEPMADESAAPAPNDELSEQYNDEGESTGDLDMRRYSFGGESITLFSRSPVRETLSDVPEETYPEAEYAAERASAEAVAEPLPTEDQPSEKPKKKKTKKKSRKGSKTEEELRDDNDSDTQLYNRRNSVANTDDVDPSSYSNAEGSKRKTRSRRSSKSSVINEDVNGNGLFSPRNSIGFGGDSLEGIAEFESADTTPLKKKTKKRKKPKEESQAQKYAIENETAAPQSELTHMDEALAAALAEIAPITVSVSAHLTPASTQMNLLSAISTGQSVCITPASSVESALAMESVINGSTHEGTNTVAGSSTSVVMARSVVDTFDILKDANFYPLF